MEQSVHLRILKSVHCSSEDTPLEDSHDGADYLLCDWIGVNGGDISGPPIEWEPGELERRL
jgi:hypothetical protein